MSEISTEIIKEVVYKLCFEANTCLDERVYSKILDAYKHSNDKILKTILQNAKIAYETKRPLCQDTGQVVVFVELGQNVRLVGELLETVINSAVEKCYVENYFRKSVVKNAVFDRSNTKTNTPVIIYTKIVEGDEVKIGVLIKGAGSENKSKLEMMLPTSNEEEIIKKCGDLILSVGENACPPMFIGIGIGGTVDKASVISKEVFLNDDFTNKENELALKIKDYVNSESRNNYVLDVKLKTFATHIACLPVAITINCHSDRISKCVICGEKIQYEHQVPCFINFENSENLKEVFANDIKNIKSLKRGDEVLLTGEIYVARDMAHKRMMETSPIDLKDKIIFYAGPCPNKPNEVIGSVGPTTASRMDKYAEKMYEMGLLATIGKGSRSVDVENIIKKTGAKYFTVIGGVAALLAEKVKSSEVIAYEDLGAEALYKIYVDKLPIKVAI